MKISYSNKPSESTKDGLIERMFNRLYNSKASDKYFDNIAKTHSPNLAAAMRQGALNPLSFKERQMQFPVWSDDVDAIDLADDAELPMGTASFKNAGTTAKLAGNWVANNKLKSAGLGATGLMNLSGLFDNDQIVGQAAGLGLGGLAAAKVLPALGIGGIANGALAVAGGGALGSLFDKLMAKKKEEEAMQQAQYAQNRIY